jgi:hypothetical protein
VLTGLLQNAPQLFTQIMTGALLDFNAVVLSSTSISGLVLLLNLAQTILLFAMVKNNKVQAMDTNDDDDDDASDDASAVKGHYVVHMQPTTEHPTGTQ